MRIVLALVFAALSATAQDKFNHAQWTISVDQSTVAPGGSALAKLQAQIDPGWHMYSLTTPPGPIPTTIRAVDSPAVAKVTILQPPPIKKFDPNFNAETETYEGSQTFYARIELKKDAAAGPVSVTLEPRYQTCSGTSCIPPRTRAVTASLTVAADAKPASLAVPAGYIEAVPGSRAPAGGSTESGGLAGFLAVAFGVGLAAIFTPCVFPMIPITMSYFVGQKGGLAQAITFCLGIVVLFTGLGLAATLVLGPAGVVQLGGNPWVNGFIALVFFVFGLSLLGAFEITIPSGILTRLNSASGQGGFVGTLLMGLTFALASFACVGPFMGTLLAASVTGGKLRPLLGMASFSSGLAFPFFLLALFPSWLAKLPRSGEWLARVKVVMGFLVLAFMLKYLYSLDAVLQLHVLTRERFLAAAFVLVAMAGFYLLGFVRLPGISADAELGVSRLMIGMLFVVAAISLIPGMFGGRLGEIEGFIPQPDSNSISGTGGGAEEQVWAKNDLAGAFARARAENKLVLADFTGYACTNCKWMKANMFPRPEIAAVVKNMVLVELYTDGTDEASQANQKLEEEKFQTVAIPFYVLYDANQNVLATFADKTSDSQKYLAFLNTQPAPGAPTQAPPLTAQMEGAPFKTLDGGALSMDAWKGKVVVLNYWATWCIPCRQEIPEFNRIQADLGSKGVQVVGISMDEDGAEAVRPFLKQLPMKYTVGLGSGTIGQLPITLVLDRNGKTVGRFEGFTKPEAIREAIAKAQAG
jgi:thiol:disulfide interchange protein DsbD